MNYKVPYDFVLRHLYPIRPVIRKMLGSYALLHNDKILLLLREKETQLEYNGVFVATQPKYFEALRQEIHASNMDVNIDGMPHSYLFLSEDLEDFEEKIKHTCDLIKAGDERIGKTNQP